MQNSFDGAAYICLEYSRFIFERNPISSRDANPFEVAPATFAKISSIYLRNLKETKGPGFFFTKVTRNGLERACGLRFVSYLARVDFMDVLGSLSKEFAIFEFSTRFWL